MKSTLSSLLLTMIFHAVTVGKGLAMLSQTEFVSRVFTKKFPSTNIQKRILHKKKHESDITLHTFPPEAKENSSSDSQRLSFHELHKEFMKIYEEVDEFCRDDEYVAIISTDMKNKPIISEKIGTTWTYSKTTNLKNPKDEMAEFTKKKGPNFDDE